MKRPFRRKRLDRFLRFKLDSEPLLGLTQEDGAELLREAGRRFVAGEFAAASRLFILHLRYFGPTADGWLGEGACCQSKGELTEAVKAYNAAIKLRPGDLFARTNLAECALLANEPDRALSILAAITRDNRTRVSTELAERVGRLEELANQAIRGGPLPSAVVESGENPLTDALTDVDFAVEPDLTAMEFRNILRRSTLDERRPVYELGTIDGMLANADLIVTARIDELLVGVSRAITDFHFCTYLSDLAVDRDHQRRGIGRELIRRTHEAAGLKTTLILLAAPAAREYYPHIGMTAHDSCWIIPRTPPNEGKRQ